MNKILISILVTLLPANIASALTAKEKALLNESLAGKRIVFLGEPDHWIKDKTGYQMELIDYLVEQGFTLIGNERSHVDSQTVNEFIQTGDNYHLSRCAECGYTSSDWPERKIGGTLGVPEQFAVQYANGMHWNDNRFYEHLRKLRQKNQFTYFGYDVDKIPDVIFDQLIPFGPILVESGETHLIELVQLLKRSPNGDYQKEAQHLDKALKLLREESESVRNLLGKEEHSELSKLTQQLEESVRFAAVAYNGPTDPELLAAYQDREKTMFRLTERYLKESPHSKMILLGHNAHLPRDHKEYRRVYETSEGTVEVASWFTLGSYLTEKYSEETLAIWMLYDSGNHSSPFCRNLFPCSVDSVPGTIESLLAAENKAGLMDGADVSALVNEKLDKAVWRENGINRVTGHLNSVVDLIYFKKDVSGFRGDEH